MYMTFRQMNADPGRMADALSVGAWVRDRLNNDHGGQYAVSVNVGGDPTLISLTAAWATLGDYEKARSAILGDEQLQSVIRVSGDLVSNARDSIAQIVKPPGERGAYASVNTAMMNMAEVADAVGFAVEVANFVEAKTGNAIGVMTAVTGNRASLAWVGFSGSMDQFATDAQTLEVDPDYLALFKRAEPLFVPGSLEQSLWQMLP